MDGDEILFYIYMRAPALEMAANIWGAGKNAPAEFDPTNPDHNAHAYNNIYLDNTQIDGIGRPTHAYIHWDYVKVGIVPFQIKVRKEWNDDDNRDGKRSPSVTVNLIKDGVETGQSVILDESNGWESKFDHVLRYDYDTMLPDYDGLDDGHYIEYTFTEDDVPEYEMAYDKSGSDVIVTNLHIPEKINIPFTKTWEGDEDVMSEQRPSSIVVRLFANGVFTGQKMVVRPDEEGVWAGEFTDMFRYEHGQEIEYTVQEEYVDNYLATYDGTDITNAYYPYGDLSVEKVLENETAAAAEKEFTFTLLLKDSEGNDAVDKYNYTIINVNEPDIIVSDGTIGHGDIFTLKGGQKLIVTDIPSHFHYEVVEDKLPGFRIANKEHDTGEILTGIPSEAVFTNHYSSRGSAEIKAFKVLAGRDLMKNQFRFELLDEEDTLIRLVSNKVDGTVNFGSIRFTEADDGTERTYTVKERNTAKDGYTYDDTVYIVKVKVTDNGDGTMTSEIKYYPGDAQVFDETTEISMTSAYVFADRFEMTPEEWDALSEQEKEELVPKHQKPDYDPDDPASQLIQPVLVERNEALFHNEYHATGEITLRAWKQLIGRALADGEFTFDLLAEAEEEGQPSPVIQTKTNQADGSIVFDPIEFDETDIGKTYYYFVREKAGSDETINYDTSTFGYSVKVVDNGDGTLSFLQKNQSVAKEALEGDNKLLHIRVPYWGLDDGVGYGHDADYYLNAFNNKKFATYWPSDIMSAYESAAEADAATTGKPTGVYANPAISNDPPYAANLSGEMVYGSVRLSRWLEIPNIDGESVSILADGVREGLYPSITEALHYSIGGSSINWAYIEELDSQPASEWSHFSDYVPGKLYVVSNREHLNHNLVYIFIRYVDFYYLMPPGYKYEVTGETDEIPLFTNTLKEGSLSVTKLTKWNEGDEPDPNQVFHFKIRLVNPDGTPIDDQSMEYVPEQIENIGPVSETPSPEPTPSPDPEP